MAIDCVSIDASKAWIWRKFTYKRCQYVVQIANGPIDRTDDDDRYGKDMGTIRSDRV